MKTTPIPVRFDRQGHSCNFFAGFGPTVSGVSLLRCLDVLRLQSEALAHDWHSSVFQIAFKRVCRLPSVCARSPEVGVCLADYLLEDMLFPISHASVSSCDSKGQAYCTISYERDQRRCCEVAEDSPRCLRHSAKETPAVAFEPTTAKLRALRSAD